MEVVLLLSVNRCG